MGIEAPQLFSVRGYPGPGPARGCFVDITRQRPAPVSQPDPGALGRAWTRAGSGRHWEPPSSMIRSGLCPGKQSWQGGTGSTAGGERERQRRQNVPAVGMNGSGHCPAAGSGGCGEQRAALGHFASTPVTWCCHPLSRWIFSYPSHTADLPQGQGQSPHCGLATSTSSPGIAPWHHSGSSGSGPVLSPLNVYVLREAWPALSPPWSSTRGAQPAQTLVLGFSY